ncbi:uncharacterized protein [Mytilus edulis]|uniref:uncharacterized protein n=1 Tax=Mytilus edulis TaxID=6550 RepID=UPI0039EEA93B
MESSNILKLLCCLLCVADHDVTGIPYPGDDASVPELVQYYHQLCYTSLQICGFLLFVHGTFMSCSMLKRLKRRLNIRRRNNQSPLPTVVRTILALHRNGLSNVGYRYMWRTLNIGFGLCVTQSRARLCLRTIDQQGVLNRSRRVLRRRVYYNRGPNYLIHVDGYDKLKPYGIAIHGAMDGYSRKLLWLIASPSNNNPRYVGYWYLNWIKQRKMLPRVVRSDAGTENVIMRDLQRSLRHNQNDEMSGQNSFLVGRSVANQRIERLWGTLKTSFTQFWRNRFQDFQDTGLVNVSCPVHKECVRFCFLSVIQHQLDMFAENWNSHRIRRQRAEVVTPSGIPNMLYYQPEIFGGRDCSFPLPCNLQTIDNLIEEYTENFPEHGCSNEFINIVELLTGNRRDQFPIITSYDHAELLFRTLIAALPN